MNVKSYISKQKINDSCVIVIVEDGTSIPDEIIDKFAPFDPPKSLDLQPGQHRIGIDADEAIVAIQRQGYSIQGFRIEVGSPLEKITSLAL